MTRTSTSGIRQRVRTAKFTSNQIDKIHRKCATTKLPRWSATTAPACARPGLPAMTRHVPSAAARHQDVTSPPPLPLRHDPRRRRYSTGSAPRRRRRRKSLFRAGGQRSAAARHLGVDDSPTAGDQSQPAGGNSDDKESCVENQVRSRPGSR